MSRPETEKDMFPQKQHRAMRVGLCALALLCVILAITATFHNLFWNSQQPTRISNSYTRPQNPTAEVLLIMSYTESDPDTVQARNGVLDVMGRSNVGVDVMYMDAYLSPKGSDAYQTWVTHAGQKVSQHGKYDAVICSDDEALLFVEENYESLFPQTPVIFFGVNDFVHALEISGQGYITGIVEQSYYGSLMNVLVGLHPEAKSFVAIVDETPAGNGNRAQFDLAMQGFQNMSAMYLNASQLTREQLGSSLANIGRDSIILLLDANVDQSGRYYPLNQTVPFISNSAKVPVYRTSAGGVGDGLAGSGYIDPVSDGQKAAETAIEIINGTHPAEIPVSFEGNLGYIFDADVLLTHGISTANLPAGSIVMNRNVISFDTLRLLVLPIALLLFAGLFFYLAFRIRNQLFPASDLGKVDDDSVSYPSSEKQNPVVNSNKQDIANRDLKPNQIEEKSQVESEVIHTIQSENAQNKQPDTKLISNAQPDVSSSNKHITRNRVPRRRHNDPRALVGFEITRISDIGRTRDSVVLSRALQIIRQRFEGHDSVMHVRERKNGLLVAFQGELKKGSDEMDFLEFALRQPLVVDGDQIPFDSCACVVNRQDGMSIADMEKCITFAIGQCKQSGCRESIVFYDEEMRLAMQERDDIADQLKEAIVAENILVLYQPLVEIKSNSVCGYKAVVGLQGNPCPSELLYRVAEDAGLAVDMERIVLMRVVEQLSRWKRRKKRIRPITVNASVLHLEKDDDYVDFVIGILGEHNIPTSCIRVEITETFLSFDEEKTDEFVSKLSQSGIAIVTDHSGKDPSTFRNIMTVPAAIVKIDREFVKSNLTKDGDYTLLEQFTKMAQGSGKQVIITGLEEKWQLDICRRLGCDIGQGNLFSKPLLPENAVQFRPA